MTTGNKLLVRFLPGSAAIFTLVLLLTSCSTPREFRTAKEYYETGELKKEEMLNPYEYECKVFYKNGKTKKVVYGTEGHLLVREFHPDGKLKREEKASPNLEFDDYMK